MGSFRDMAKRVFSTDEEALSSFGENYGFLSEYGAHPRAESFVGLMSQAKEGHAEMHLGPFYNEKLAGITLHCILAQLAGVLSQVGKIALMHGIDPAEISLPTEELLDEAIEQLRERGNSRDVWG